MIHETCVIQINGVAISECQSNALKFHCLLSSIHDPRGHYFPRIHKYMEND